MPLGSQGFSHILTLSPFPIRQIYPSFSSSAPFRILLHVYEIPAFGTHRRISLCGKYFALRTCPHNVSGLMSLHACLHNISILTRCKSRKPRPPFFFDLVRFSQLSQCILLVLSCWLHQYLAIIMLNSSQSPLVRPKHDMA